MNEFDLIDLIIEEVRKAPADTDVVVGTGDDAAVVHVSQDQELVVTTDVLVGGVHFPIGARGDLVGYRAIAVNFSDLSAMGAKPKFLTVALTIDEADVDWIRAFAQGIVTCASECGATVVGGNLSRGPLSVAVTAHGVVAKGRALLRSGAVIGDLVWVTGSLGATSVFLKTAQDLSDVPLQELLGQRNSATLARYFLPPLRHSFASGLVDVATSAIDVSDGLIADLKHVTDASGCGALLDLAKVPIWPGADLQEAVGPNDSYELLFSAPLSLETSVFNLAEETGTPVAMIGEIDDGTGIRAFEDPDAELVVEGFTHF